MKAFRHDVGILAFLPFLMRMQAFESLAPAVTRRKENLAPVVTRRKENLLSSAGVGLSHPAPLFYMSSYKRQPAPKLQSLLRKRAFASSLPAPESG